MYFRSILRALGVILLILGLTLLVPALYAWAIHSPDLEAFLRSAVYTIGTGGLLLLIPKSQYSLRTRDGFALVSFGWLAAGVVGGLPYLLADVVPSFTDAFFESVSGFTTTGASIFTVIEDKPLPVLLWRSMTQWFGGMGIIVLALAIVPYMDIGGMSIFQAEVPGPTADKLTPKVEDTAKVLWIVYVIMTLALMVSLWAAGMTVFDAINHAFTTMATGGFSTKNASILFYRSPLIEWIVILFMALAGMNFALHYHFLFGRFKPKTYLKDSEAMFYLAMILFSVASITGLILWKEDRIFSETFRAVTFTVTSIITTTGYATDDYELWPIFSHLMLLLLMVMGGCAGSTAGGVKSVRIMLVLKYVYVEMVKLLHPNLVRDVKMHDTVVERSVLSSILSFLFLYLTVLVVSILLVSFEAPDILTAISSVVTSLGNVGPGLGTVGPTENFAHLGDFTKWVLSINMVLGRLEILTLLVLFLPQTWLK
ncbi:MAG: hypothetical protein A2600_03590 [Candidatus Lambdaproteobacteria bacterium RIFOXYD1_FULL_56_27]|uniref:Trk system potassium uptake protein n=1 Tax=Candidatus Lambdaproteobacteria bacterium RIFOXYD2_FULL_56_26 TaxID=1817773 RepID=A0A1F6H3H3_9PROT|nr:MAG: hypothetical protein A2426_11650 [Candidatus Lambdaproteobacteria bacterium RIFOXYC1_FULL_56_13]OGH04850.1 MAG: hypothetical protein A2557_07655 [Candidatus Lambdaproteobacteria bacterium RIFOXYD2_FULL_56_26]OGH09315.1 MAG: hypothetical protein A2600_03590 [Candidatus Lambdaproteobacteria bacterium RIFOXYD1_FULL_56_27]